MKDTVHGRLLDHAARHVDLCEEVAGLTAERDRVAGHHAPKIEKLRRTLRRLIYLRGDVGAGAEAGA